MSATSRAVSTRWNPIAALIIALIAIGLGGAVVAFGKLAVVGLIGAIAFCIFLRWPVVGVFSTTGLLLLSGSAGIIGAGGIEVAVPLTIAKLCGAAAFGAWLINFLVRRQRWNITWEIILLLAFFAWTLVGILFSPDRAEQFPEWIRLGTLVAFFIMTVEVLTNAEDARLKIRWFVILILMCGFLSALSAVAQYFMPARYAGSLTDIANITSQSGAIIDSESLEGVAAIRVSGRAMHSNWLALFILCVMPLNVYWFTIWRDWRARGFILFTVLIELLALVLTFTRTGLVVGVALIILLVIKGSLRPNPYRLVSLALLAVLAWVILPEAYKARVLSLGQYTSSKSVRARTDLQAAAIRYSGEHPLIGVGLGGFGMRFMYEPSPTGQIMNIAVNDFEWSPTFIGVHNLYLQLACETGFIGLALFLALFVCLMKNLYAIERRLQNIPEEYRAKSLVATLQVSLAAFLLCSVFLHALQQKIWWITAGAAAAVSLHAIVVMAEMESGEKGAQAIAEEEIEDLGDVT